MKISLTIICAALFAIATADARPISGQVFIVTKGAESVKLGLVKVGAYDLESVRSLISGIDGPLKEEREKTASITRKIQASSNACSKAQRDAFEEWMRAYSDPTLRAESERLQKLDGLFGLLEGKANHHLAFLTNAGLYFEHLPPPLATAKTDADGKFSMDVSSTGGLALGAFTTRTIADSVEIYYWLIAPSDDSKIVLSNDNLSDSGGSESLIHAGSASGEKDGGQFTALQLAQELSTLSGVPIAGVPEASAAPQPTETRRDSESSPQFVTLSAPATIAIQYGTITLEKGTRLPFVRQIGDKVAIRYYDGIDYEIPLSATDLK